jgi:formylglycine-generating enzyme required for sulfatase activity
MADVFISYARKDKGYTRKLADSLRKRGFEVWMNDHLESGDRRLRTIEQAVRDSAAVVVVMTPESRDSKWVEREILPAESEGKPIFPLLLRGRAFFLFMNKGYDDVTKGRMPPADFYERLEREVRPPLQEEIIEAPEPAVPKERVWQRLRLLLAVVGLLALVIGVVVDGVVAGGPLSIAGQPTPIPTTSVPEAVEEPMPGPTATATSKSQPPSNASLHDTWTRPADGMEMVYVPGGTFKMGSTEGASNAQPVHTVTLDSFWIDQTEVTNSQYTRCVAGGTCSPPSESGSYARDSYYGDSEFDDYPVIWVNWNDANEYCVWAGGQLPTEAEWEYAARGLDGHIYPWGDNLPNDTLLNYNGDVGDTTQVGSYPTGASWVGAMDMAGNVWEWVNDWYGSDYYASPPSQNPQGPEMGSSKVLRGGSWLNVEEYVRAAYRYGYTRPDFRFDSYGFRCVVEPGN